MGGTKRSEEGASEMTGLGEKVAVEIVEVGLPIGDGIFEEIIGELEGEDADKEERDEEDRGEGEKGDIEGDFELGEVEGL